MYSCPASELLDEASLEWFTAVSYKVTIMTLMACIRVYPTSLYIHADVTNYFSTCNRKNTNHNIRLPLEIRSSLIRASESCFQSSCMWFVIEAYYTCTFQEKNLTLNLCTYIFLS